MNQVDVDAVLAANRAFYEAFERRDLDAMSDLWELRGWGAVAGSWFALFGSGAPLQFILLGEQAHVDGDVAWVTVEENLIGDGGGGSTVSALNLFRRRDGVWRMVAHHGSPVAPHGPG